ncbi:hypothetical protein BOX15_Mlig017231g1 [Macrostomum lignano]|uniref:TRPM SLOG domain-containing protein n=1 Tax=Macrostomum lignano TaxID=282301 RepID=A0A267FD75_9PLAT|nr:hypothetical protein BOX15_Mlig017231g1 [Macrostomum lignano]
MSRVGVLPSESLQPPGQSAAGRSRSDLHSSLNSYTNPAYDTARSEEVDGAANEEIGTARFSRARSQRKREEQLVEQQRSLRQFILANFQRKECCLFEAKDGKKCACGEVREKHDGLLPAGPEEKWNEATHMRRSVTNAYGRITLKNEGFDNRDPIHFARVCDEDSMDKMLELMKTHWQLADPQKPSLCISVIGGAKNFKLEGRKKEVFHHGLIRAAQTTNAWIITSGLNLGITRVVGNALEEGRASHWEKSSRSSKLRCIGVAPWGYVLNRDHLINKRDPKIGELSLDVEYKISNVISKGQPVSLNANHTHYLLVDDGKRNRYGGSKSGVIKAKLQEQINQKEGISVVLLIVEGGLDIFEETQSMIQSNIPVVTCDNTGRAADIIAFAYKKVQKADKKTLSESQLADLRERMISTFSDNLKDPKTKKVNDKKVDENMSMLLEIVQKEKLITVFDMNRSDDLDLAILSALLKVMDAKRLDDYKQQLQLSMTWNRPDIAAEKIFTEEHQWGTENLDKFALSAISQEKIEFLRLFLKNGLIMREFLTVGRLRSLYRESLAASSQASLQVRKLLAARTRCRNPWEPTLADIRVLLRKLVGKFHAPSMDKDVGTGGDDEQFERPFNQLFFWAVLLCKQDTAKFLWERTDESVPLALAASKVYNEMARALSSHEDGRKRMLQAYKDEFEELAVHVVEECQMVDPSKAELLIEKKVEAFGDFNCLELAASANCKKFVSCNSSQNSITSRWLNGLMHGTSNLRIFLCVVLPFLLPFEFLVRVEPSVRLDEGGRCAQLAHKVRIYYTAPVTKFFANAIWYVIFIFLYSWFILFEMKAASISWLEWVIIAWICVMVVEEIREMFSSKADTVQEKLRDWWGFSAWNRLDLFTMLLALIGIFLRIPEATDAITTGVRTCYILAGVLFYLRVFRLYYANSYLGPKLVMIQKMVKELLFYMSILIVALLTYGVAAQALLYPTRDFTTSIFVDIVYYPYWQIYGEIYLEVAEATPPEGCEDGSTVDSSGKLCPTHHSLVLLLLAVYLMVVNVLLINLLIAIFSNIFKEIQNNSVEIWKFNMYFLVHEYHTRPVLAVPFVIVEDVFRFIRFLACRLPCCRKGKEGESGRLSQREEADLRNFTTHCLSLVNTRQELETKGRIEQRIQSIYSGLDELYKMCDRIDERFDDERHQGSGGGSGGGDREGSATSTKPRLPPAAAAAAAPEASQPPLQLPSGSNKRSPTVSVNEDVQLEKPKPSKDLGLPPIDPDARPQTPKLQTEPPTPPPAPTPIGAAPAPADEHQEVEAERKRQRRAEKERRRLERRMRRRSRSRHRPSDDEEERGAVGGGGFAYQTLNDFNDFGAAEAGTEEERLVDMERRLRNMEAATTDSLGSIEKLLRQIVKDRSSKPDYARLQ